MANEFDRSFYGREQYGMPNAWRRKKEQDALDEQLRQFNEQMAMKKEENAWDESSDVDVLQALLGGAELAGGVASSIFAPPGVGQIIGAPLIGAGSGTLTNALGRRKARNRITGESKYI